MPAVGGGVVAEGCLLLVWQVVSAFLPIRVQRAVSQSQKASSDSHGPTKLQYKHIEGCLYLLFLGYAISTLAFFGELVRNRCRPGTSSSNRRERKSKIFSFKPRDMLPTLNSGTMFGTNF
jgi:hypothetical protein